MRVVYRGWRRTSQGMTIMELLVVIAIIALLAAIVMPTVVGLQERGRKIYCANNLRQIGLGVKTYLMDNDNIFPSATAANKYGELADIYREELDGSYEAFRCPSQHQDLPAIDAGWADQLPFPSDATRWTRYEFNGYLMGRKNYRKGIPDPTRAAYVYDFPFYDDNYSPHARGVNVLYVDWHVAWLEEADYGTGTNEFARQGHTY
jgi:prepilin-type N-terminal cleavage/methylation domain-containing protein/prepilin-type processing-associated H-X9-DG protein